MSATPDERQAIYRRAAEMQVINHAMKQHNGCAPEICGGSSYDPCHLGNAIEDLLRRYSRIGGWQAATADAGAEMVKRLDLGQETGSLVVDHGAEIAEREPQHDPASGELSIAERAALAVLGWRDRYVAAPDKMTAARATLMLLNQLEEIYPREREPQHDPISGELIPAGQDAELERRGREIAAEPCTCPLGPEDAHFSDCPMYIHGWDELAPLWVPRTWADVRRGDVVRMPGTDVVAAIVDRLWHPSEDPRGESWHVVSDGSIGQWAHTSDRVVRPGECVIVSPDIPGSERGRWMDPAACVEIQISSAAMLARIEELGWANRQYGN